MGVYDTYVCRALGGVNKNVRSPSYDDAHPPCTRLKPRRNSVLGRIHRAIFSVTNNCRYAFSLFFVQNRVDRLPTKTYEVVIENTYFGRILYVASFFKYFRSFGHAEVEISQMYTLGDENY